MNKSIEQLQEFVDRTTGPSLAQISLERVALSIPVPGYRLEDISVSSDCGYLFVHLTQPEIGFFRPPNISYLVPVGILEVEDVTLSFGVLIMQLAIPSRRKEYQINIPSPGSHPQYLSENSTL